jgi:Tle cognate immunity protein 4 C-terminal domain
MHELTNATGYCNAFEAIRAKVPRRPQLADDTGTCRHGKPTAQRMLTGTVVGPDGQTSASDADEIHADRLGWVRTRFDFQTQTQGLMLDGGWLVRWTLILFASLACACSEVDPPVTMNAHPRATSNMSNFCVGRLQLDLPEHFEPGPTSEIEFYFGKGADHQRVTLSLAEGDAKAAATRRASDLAAQHHFQSSSKNRLHAVREISADTMGVWGYEGARSTDAFRVEVFRQVGSQSIRFAELAFQGRRPEQVEARLVELAARASPMANGSGLPAGRGACLGRVLLDVVSDGEIVNVLMRSKQWPGLRIEAQTNSLAQEPDGGLLNRWERGARGFKGAGFEVKVLQRGATTVGALQAEELLTLGTEEGRSRWDFDLESSTYIPTLAKPAIRIAMRAHEDAEPGRSGGQPATEAELISFWRAMVGAVRPRPGAV